MYSFVPNRKVIRNEMKQSVINESGYQEVFISKIYTRYDRKIFRRLKACSRLMTRVSAFCIELDGVYDFKLRLMTMRLQNGN